MPKTSKQGIPTKQDLRHKKNNISVTPSKGLDTSDLVPNSQPNSEEDASVSNEVLSIARKISSRIGDFSLSKSEGKKSRPKSLNASFSLQMSPKRGSPQKSQQTSAKRQRLEVEKPRDSDSDSSIEPSQWRPSAKPAKVPKNSPDSTSDSSSNEDRRKPSHSLKKRKTTTASHSISLDVSHSEDEGSSTNTSRKPSNVSVDSADGDERLSEFSLTTTSQNSMRFQCPANYTQRSVSARALTFEDVQGKDVDLWLIKAPNKTNMTMLNNKEALVNGSVILKKEESKTGTTYVWELNCRHDPKAEANSTTVLLPSKKDSKLHFAGQLGGQIHLTKSVQVDPYILPDMTSKPRLQLPTGLKLRYQPFGAGQPVVSSARSEKHGRKSKSQDSVDGIPDSFGHTPKSKKKKKKHKRDSE